MNKFTAVVHWILALVLAFFLVNGICFFYERPVGWQDTPNGVSPSAWHPGTLLVHGIEGYAITKIDANGYVNPPGVLADSHILMMGSSHTQAKEISMDQKYSVLGNDYFSKGEELVAYSIASDGNFLPTVVKHFSNAVRSFPGAKIVTIELDNVDFTAIQLEEA